MIHELTRRAATAGVIAAAMIAGAPTRPDAPRLRSAAPTGAGAVEGRIVYEGEPPPPTIVVEGGGTQRVLHLDTTGGLQYVVVFLSDSPREGAAPAGATAVMNQRSFMFEPQALAVRAGQPVRFTNDDSANHNVRSIAATAADTFSIYTGTGEARSHRFIATPPGRPIALSCDIHPWMASWIYVFDHPHFATTDSTGRFRIDNVTRGRHRLAIRHAAGRLARDLVVDVAAGRTTRRDMRFTARDLGSQPPDDP